MNNLNVRHFLTVALLLCGAFFLASCGGGTTTTNTTNTTTTTNKAGNSTTTTTTNTTTTTTSADSVGVAECDEYIKKYEACVNSKVPEAQRAAFKSSFETMRKSWKDAAANPQSKAALATGCKQALDQAKQTLGAYACEW
jgi:hypothetical protein